MKEVTTFGCRYGKAADILYQGLLRETMLETEECTKGCFTPHSTSEHFTIDDVDVLNAPNPPLPFSHPFHPEPWMGCEPNRNMEIGEHLL
jgi:hypothetical protein